MRPTEHWCKGFKLGLSIQKCRNDYNTSNVFSLNMKGVRFPKAVGGAQEVEENVWPSLL